ncbi:hypothetical protein GX411_09600 [Candidatus Fermentibacteria bacterium]|nr:hypothetical protein [Candidatus Fermentibacteria bacterium]
MKMHMYRLVSTAVLLLAGVIFASTAHADGVYGDFAVDWYYMAGHHMDGDVTGEGDTLAIDGYNAFQLRRIRMGFKRSLAPNLAMDFRLEAGMPDFLSNIQGNSAVATPFVKDAHMTWSLSDDVNLRFGLQGNLINENPESFWGYRSVEKTILDLQKIEPSRDLGISLNATLDDFSLRILAGNGNGDKSESYEGKEIFATAGYRIMPGLLAEAGICFEAENDEDQTHTTLLGLLGYQSPAFHGGVQYAMYKQAYGDDTEDLDINLLSVFGAVPVSPKMEVLARYDMSDANPAADGIQYFRMADYAPTNTIIAGVAYTPVPNFQLIPNVEYVSYGDPEEEGVETPDADTIVRLTIWNKW